MSRLPEALAGRADPRHTRPLEPPDLSETLAAGCVELGLTLDFDERKHLLSYIALLQHWNRVYNLTAIRDPAQMLVQHLLDSLAVLRPLQAAWAMTEPPGQSAVGPTLLDVGSGAGLPGLVLALAWPELQADLVEPVGKKAAFLRQSAAELGLVSRVRVHGCRVEDLSLARAPDIVICRAFSSLRDFTARIGSLIGASTRVFAMKGRRAEIDDEAEALATGWRVDEVVALVVPGLDAARHLVRLSPPPKG